MVTGLHLLIRPHGEGRDRARQHELTVFPLPAVTVSNRSRDGRDNLATCSPW